MNSCYLVSFSSELLILDYGLLSQFQVSCEYFDFALSSRLPSNFDPLILTLISSMPQNKSGLQANVSIIIPGQ